MNEYLSREAMLKNLTADLEHHSDECDPRTVLVMQRFIKYVEDFPVADVQPMKHGRWSECYTDSHHYSGICTVCGKASIRSIKENPLEYCPKCGARMDGDSECQ
jgi:hypothetical protein